VELRRTVAGLFALVRGAVRCLRKRLGPLSAHLASMRHIKKPVSEGKYGVCCWGVFALVRMARRFAVGAGCGAIDTLVCGAHSNASFGARCPPYRNVRDGR